MHISADSKATLNIDRNGTGTALFNHLNDVPVSDWDSCISVTNIFLSRKYLKVAEKSQLPGMQFRYAIYYNEGVPSAVIYFQLVNLSDKSLGGFLNLDDYGGLAASVAGKINDLLFCNNGNHSWLMVCGNLLLSGEHAISAVNDDCFKRAVASVTGLKKQIQDSLNTNDRIVGYLVKDFYEYHDSIAAPLLKKDYFSLNTDPEMILDLDPAWSSFDDYLGALSSKYRIRTKSAIKKLSGVRKVNLSLEEINLYEDEIYNLNDQVMRKAPVKLARPSSKYFVNLKKSFHEHYHLNGFFHGKKLIAFTSGLYNKVHYEAHYIGLDYHYNKSHSLYQNLLYSFIEDAIDVKSSRLFFGRTALEIKSTTGAKPSNLASYLRFSGKIMNTLIRPLVRSTGPGEWVPRDPFKNGNGQ